MSLLYNCISGNCRGQQPECGGGSEGYVPVVDGGGVWWRQALLGDGAPRGRAPEDQGQVHAAVPQQTEDGRGRVLREIQR